MAAVAMVVRPELVVFYDPTMTLDVTRGKLLASLPKLVRKHGTAALSTKQDFSMMAQVADRVMALRCGRLVEFIAKGEILAIPQGDYICHLVSERVVSHHGARAATDTWAPLPGRRAGRVTSRPAGGSFDVHGVREA